MAFIMWQLIQTPKHYIVKVLSVILWLSLSSWKSHMKEQYDRLIIIDL